MASGAGAHVEIPLRCAHCGTESTRSLDMLEMRPVFPCRGCGALLDSTQVVSEMRRVCRRMGLARRPLGTRCVQIDFDVRRG